MRPPLREIVCGRDLRRSLPDHDLTFLRTLGAPTLISLAGRDSSRTRVVSTLLHGNEPSGLRAILRYLRSSEIPATNVLFFIGAVGTALSEPEFSHRSLPGQLDANRVWTPPWEGPESSVAREVLERIKAAQPECVVDLHNNTGHNPAYGVAFHIGPAELFLVSLFADRVVHTPIELRTLVEATVNDFPSVTIECGRAGDPAADEAASLGLNRLLTQDAFDFEHPHRPVLILGAPVRVCLREGSELTFADAPDRSVPLTISKNIDRHNFERLAPGSPIGWLSPGASWPLHAVGDAGKDCSRAIFEVDGEILRTRREFTPIMMTTNRAIAHSDCLFYAVQPMVAQASNHDRGFHDIVEHDVATSTSISTVGAGNWWA